MGALGEALRGHSLVGVDTNCFVYAFEGQDQARALRDDFFITLRDGEIRAVTSVLTVTEILVRPKSLGAEDVAQEYLATLLTFPNLKLLDITLATAVRAAELRAKYRVRTPDAIQVATAIEAGATAFLTNDKALKNVSADIQVLCLANYL